MSEFYPRPRLEAKYTISCAECDGEVSNLDIALTKKMISRGATKYLCIDCIGKKLGMTRKELYEKAEQFKKQGCTLFR